MALSNNTAREMAIALIHNIMINQGEITKRVNSGNGKVPKRLIKQEEKCIRELFRELVGGEVNNEELERIRDI